MLLAAVYKSGRIVSKFLCEKIGLITHLSGLQKLLICILLAFIQKFYLKVWKDVFLFSLQGKNAAKFIVDYLLDQKD
jgi:hypothetical protein